MVRGMDTTFPIALSAHGAEPCDLAPRFPALSLHQAVLDGRTASTLRAYAGDYRDFARFLGVADPGQALDALVAFAPGLAHQCAVSYRAHLIHRKLAPATIARRLASLRSAVKLARQLGRVNWSLEIEAPAQESYRDTSGPGLDGWHALLGLAEVESTSARGRRDLALIRLLHDLALRRGEVVGIDLADLELAGGKVAIRGKGRHHKIRLTLSRAARLALQTWIGDRGDFPGPLFLGFNRGKPGPSTPRLTGESVRLVVRSLARRAGVAEPVRPHGLRHQAITEALDATNGDVRKVAKFSRHRKIETVLRYDDARADVGGEIAGLLGDS